MKKLLVVARYRENIGWVDQTGWPHLIYNKGPALARPCITVPNKGRDTETILRYILEHYHCLPDLVVFAQGDPFPHCRDFLERLAVTNGYTEFTMNRVDETNHADFPPRVPHAKAILARFNMPVPERLMFVKGMQYAVPKEMIVSKPFDWWLELYRHSMCDARNPWFYEMIWPEIWSLNLTSRN